MSTRPGFLRGNQGRNQELNMDRRCVGAQAMLRDRTAQTMITSWEARIKYGGVKRKVSGPWKSKAAPASGTNGLLGRSYD